MKKKLFILAIMISTFAAGFEHTFLNTLIPQITYDLGGVKYFTWLSISFTLGNMVLLPIIGILADRIDKKKIFLWANIELVIGCLLSAFSQNMFELIFFRFLTGIGAGIITVMNSILIAKVFKIEERVKWNAFSGIVYSISTLCGPTVASTLAVLLSWRWIFASPIILFSISNFLFVTGGSNFLKEEQKPVPIKINNYLILLFMITLLCLMISFGGVTIPILSMKFFLLSFVFVFLAVIFYLLEKKSNGKTLPYHLFKNKLYLYSVFISVGSAIGKLTLLTFVPIFLVISMQITTQKAGYALIPMMISSQISVFISGKMLSRVPYRWIVFWNSFATFLGIFMFTFVTKDTSYLYILFASFINGWGSGAVSVILLLVIQDLLPKEQLAEATSSFTMFRWFGNLIGVSFGSFLFVLFSNFAFHSTKHKINLDNLYHEIFKSNTASITEWTSVFQHLFLTVSVVLLLFSLFSFKLYKGVLKEK